MTESEYSDADYELAQEKTRRASAIAEMVREDVRAHRERLNSDPLYPATSALCKAILSMTSRDLGEGRVEYRVDVPLVRKAVEEIVKVARATAGSDSEEHCP